MGPAAVVGERLAAYRRNVAGNLRAALAATYPVLASLVGPERFDALCAGHVAACPSRDGDLNAYGAGFEHTVAADAASPRFPWLADLARLEWVLQGAYAAADSASLPPESLLAVPPERQAGVRLALWPGADLIVSPWPIGAIWRAHALAPAERDAALAAIDLAPRGFAVLAARNAQGSPEALDFSPGEAALWDACRAGRSLSSALDAAVAVTPDLPVADVMARWFAHRLVVGVE